jgi:cellobiose transport system permease protein
MAGTTTLTFAERRQKWDVKLSPFGFISPYFLIFGVFGLFPLLYTAFVSLQKRNLIDAEGATFIGFGNYDQLLFHDPYFWNAMGNTVSLWLLTTIPQILFALGIAHLLNRRLRGRTMFRMGMILPNTASSHTAIASMVVWRWTGYHALIFLASMQAIPSSMYEAATLDGAKGWQQFWRITVPLLRPQIIFSTVIATTGNMRLLAEPLLFNPGTAAATGGSDRQFQTAALYLYEQGFTKYDFGYSSAIALILAVATMLVAGLSYLVTRRIQTD